MQAGKASYSLLARNSSFKTEKHLIALSLHSAQLSWKLSLSIKDH